MQRLASAKITLCGVGALGSNLADTLARQGVKDFHLIDKDRVEEQNIGTQIYFRAEVGAWKVEVLRNRLFRTTGIEVESVNNELTAGNANKLLKEGGLIVDLFDNSSSRKLVQETSRHLSLPCLHVGVNDGYAEVIWDEDYRVPADVPGEVCEYPLARNLILLAVTVAAETIVRFFAEGIRESWTITLKDLSIRRRED